MNRREAFMRRRQQVTRQRMVVATITLLVVFCGTLLGSSMASVRSEASAEHGSIKYYTSIQIEQGDTLWSIADTYLTAGYATVQDYIDEVKELNHLGPDEIHSGQYLTIPYYSDEFLD